MSQSCLPFNNKTFPIPSILPEPRVLVFNSVSSVCYNKITTQWVAEQSCVNSVGNSEIILKNA